MASQVSYAFDTRAELDQALADQIYIFDLSKPTQSIKVRPANIAVDITDLQQLSLAMGQNGLDSILLLMQDGYERLTTWLEIDYAVIGGLQQTAENNKQYTLANP